MLNPVAHRAHAYLTGHAVPPERLAALLHVAPQSGDGATMKAITALIDDKTIDVNTAHRAWAHAKAWPFVGRDTLDTVPDDVIDMIPAPVARELGVLPYAEDRGALLVATSTPGDRDKALVLQGHAHRPIRLAYAADTDLKRAVNLRYSTSVEAVKAGQAAVRQMGPTQRETETTGAENVSEINAALNAIIEGALRRGASDIHLEPGADGLSVRYSIDGRLVDDQSQPLGLADRMAGVIKARAELGSESIRNQDGVLSHAFNGRSYDLRVAVMPAQYGESITLRLGQSKVIPLDQIGFAEDTERSWRRALAQPNGLILATGPMGSGKTNLNYSSLNELLGEGRKIVSLEDPVEMKMRSGITQVSIRPNRGMDWDDVMGTTLRMAASVLFIGEINKKSIAQTALEAAYTGHLVLSTLHTNDAPSSVVRLREMGASNSVLADALRAVCAQRLPARLCPECRVRVRPSRDNTHDFKLTGEDLAGEWWGPSENGCAACDGNSFKGRVPIHELMTFPREVRALIHDGARAEELGDAARANGMRTLAEDGLQKARAGLTSLDELRRHLIID